MTREELYESDRGEREYYESKADLKNRIRLPLTKDGCEALLQIVTTALELPFDETMRQVFAGFVHNIPNGENYTTLDVVGKYLYKHMANHATWTFDQESKERVQAEKDKKKAEATLTLAKDADESKGESASVQ